MERRMLQLKNIVKDYVSGDTTVQALKGIDITFSIRIPTGILTAITLSALYFRAII